ncbi:hypothetical protein NC652_001952 [Populus alba x Populus x berolinensis]|nr:hypothetical protein NC652_001952 [Populus alba x Populus x berolinensis]
MVFLPPKVFKTQLPELPGNSTQKRTQRPLPTPRNLHFYLYQDLSSFQQMSSLLTNQYVSSAVDVSFTGEADQCTDVSADRLRHDVTVLQQSSS